MPEWYERALRERQDASAALRFAEDFLAAPDAERREVVAHWDPELEWALPSPFRIACEVEVPGSVRERARADLLFQSLGLAGVDARDAIMGLAIVFHSCRLGEVDPVEVFEEVAAAVGGEAERSLRAFLERDPADRSMEAFRLTAVPDDGGGCEIRVDW